MQATLRLVNHFESEQAKHGAFFDLIKNEEHWKGPIHCIIPERDFNLFDDAVRFFTSGSLTVVKKHGSLVECKANGYWVDCGA